MHLSNIHPHVQPGTNSQQRLSEQSLVQQKTSQEATWAERSTVSLPVFSGAKDAGESGLQLIIPVGKGLIMHITFHGAARTVTGSQHLLEVNGKRLPPR